MSSIESIEDLRKNHLVYDAVTLRLMQIGEEARIISNEVKTQFPRVKWDQLKGLRNQISHNYDGLRLDIIYYSAKIDVPVLLGQVNNYLNLLD